MPTARPEAPVGFALQGGGAHGAFTGGYFGSDAPSTWCGPGQRSSYDIDSLLKSV